MILLLTLLTPLSAFAEPNTDLECTTPYVAFTSPSVGQSGVPIDVVPAIGMSKDNCDVPENYEVVLSAGDAVLTSNMIPFDINGDRLLEFENETQLQPNTEYTLTVQRSEGWGEINEITFTTGEGNVIGLEGSPSIRLSEAFIDREFNVVTATYEINPAGDADDLSIVHIYEANSNAILDSHRVGAEASSWTRSWRMADGPDSLCLSVSQREGTGAMTSNVSEESCLNLKPSPNTNPGCSTLAIPALSWVLPLAAFAFVRRRGQ